MACTTLLVAKGASANGSTIVARNEDCENGTFNPKKLVVVEPEDQPRLYTGVTSHLTMHLPDDPMRYLCVPNVDPSAGVWGEAGANAANVGMTATETITTNAQVLGADPLVAYDAATGTPGGIGEEDLVTIVLPYVHSAREGVERLGALLQQYGTYEENGIAFNDADEVWYLETIGGHHWIARRVPDGCYAIVPNQLGIDYFDLTDAFGDQESFMCSADLVDWMKDNGLVPDGPMEGEVLYEGIPAVFNPRLCFGSDTWRDHVYNTPRAWYAMSILNPMDSYLGPDADWRPEDADLAWCREPEKRITLVDVKRVLDSHYQNTEYDPYGALGDEATRSHFRVIGINRTCETSAVEIRGDAPEALRAVDWVAMGSGPFNTFIPVYANVDAAPKYLATAPNVNCEQNYWQVRLIAAMADPEFYSNVSGLMEYQQATLGAGIAHVRKTDAGFDAVDDKDAEAYLAKVNDEICATVNEATQKLLAEVLFTRSMHMKNAFNMQDH